MFQPLETCSVELDGKVFIPAEVVKGLKSQDLATMTLAARAGYRMLDGSLMIFFHKLHELCTLLVKSGIIPPLIEALGRADCFDLQYEAVSCLAVLAGIEHIAVLEGGIILKLIHLLRNNTLDRVPLLVKATLAVANLAEFGAITRDAILDTSLLREMLPNMRPDTPLELKRVSVGAFCVLCREHVGEPVVAIRDVYPGLPFVSLMLLSSDPEILNTACMSFAELISQRPEYADALQAMPGFTSRLIALVEDRPDGLFLPTFCVLNNMLVTDEQRERCLDAGILDRIIPLLSCTDCSIAMKAAEVAGNILAGTPEQIQRAFDRGILEPLGNMLAFSWCQKVAAEAFTKLTGRATYEQLRALQSDERLTPYCGLTACGEPDVVKLVLEGIKNMVRVGAQEGKGEEFCYMFEQMGINNGINSFEN